MLRFLFFWVLLSVLLVCIFGFLDAFAGFVKIMLCCLLFDACLCRFGEGWGHKTCTGIKKTKRTKHDFGKTCAGINKTKNRSFVSYRPPALARCQGFCFLFFDACAGFVHVVVRFFDACAGFVTPTFTKHAQTSKKHNFCQAWTSSTAVTINLTCAEPIIDLWT